ncbi:WD40 repeat protein [Coniosporium tulheliwenetii]|uniref:WD40 repeat protein n=1 Tax=Coniosporium tulheliwenetii TaxID=3383036 RepID=A0ACC2ZJX8_9PEZI|nr:WD40 repeat protein [Cladosporium sp. JES 115]
MYWPIGAPRVYATSKHKLPQEKLASSNDGIQNAATSNPNGAYGEEGNEEGKETEPRANGSTVKQGPDPPQGEVKLPINGEDNPQQEGSDDGDIAGEIIGLCVTRSGQTFGTITRSTLTIWQTKPAAVLACVLRSKQSLEAYGLNVALHVHPNSVFFNIQTTRGYIITYTLASDPHARVYKAQFTDNAVSHARRRSVGGYMAHAGVDAYVGPGEGNGIREVSVRFRMAIRLDAGIARALVLDEELVIATERPPAIQCIRWTPDSAGTQTSTELLSRMSWLGAKTTIIDMIHDRPMNLSTWVTSDGKGYAVQRLAPDQTDATQKSLFRGYCFHIPESENDFGIIAAINARFSMLAIGCASGDVYIYTARDYVGNIPLSHKLRPSNASSSTGKLTFLSYSPDGYCLFAGYEKGWMTWSVFGRPGASTFSADRSISEANDEGWLLGVRDGFWIGGGSEILLLGQRDNRIWLFLPANVSRSLLQTKTGFLVYRGYDVPDLTTISAEASLWHHVQIPASYLVDQWPIRSAVISSDGKYVAVAGRHGLAHYSTNSGRWKTFDDSLMENEFTVRGGMCWHQHILIAAVESSTSHELRLYSRELALDSGQMMHAEHLPAPIVLISTSGDDSLLAYTYENILYHYIVSAVHGSVKLVQVGQIALHGIIRAPLRVRALSWILPDSHLINGDPSQDVAVATILFLVDGKLVLLSPAMTEDGVLKYEMRILAHNVEYYALMRDQPQINFQHQHSSWPPTPPSDTLVSGYHGHGLKDSLWFFDGNHMQVWIDVQETLASVSVELGRELLPTVKIPVDFYPLSALLDKGILFGIESDLILRRDISFGHFRFTTRTHLFLPALLQYHLSRFDSPAALHLAHHYQQLDYFPHALEVMLHNVLDEEVDTSPAPEQALLPSVLSFLSSFPQYLDIIVQCTRKTEVRSWRTLFAHLPPAQDLFEEALQKGSLKTAGGYVLVLHTLEELSSSSHQLIRLLRRARAEQDWDLCKELARFLMALDESGDTLREALNLVEQKSPADERGGDRSRMQDPAADMGFSHYQRNGVGLGVETIGSPSPNGLSSPSSSRDPGSKGSNGRRNRGAGDYFGSIMQ